MLALEYHEAQRDLEHYINLSYSIDDKIKDSNDLVKKVFDLLNSKRDAEETTKEISTAS